MFTDLIISVVSLIVTFVLSQVALFVRARTKSTELHALSNALFESANVAVRATEQFLLNERDGKLDDKIKQQARDFAFEIMRESLAAYGYSVEKISTLVLEAAVEAALLRLKRGVL